MSAHVLYYLRKSEKMRGLTSIVSLLLNEFDKFDNNNNNNNNNNNSYNNNNDNRSYLSYAYKSALKPQPHTAYNFAFYTRPCYGRHYITLPNDSKARRHMIK